MCACVSVNRHLTALPVGRNLCMVRMTGSVVTVFHASKGCAIRCNRYNATIAKVVPILELMAISPLWGLLLSGLR